MYIVFKITIGLVTKFYKKDKLFSKKKHILLRC